MRTTGAYPRALVLGLTLAAGALGAMACNAPGSSDSSGTSPALSGAPKQGTAAAAASTPGKCCGSEPASALGQCGEHLKGLGGPDGEHEGATPCSEHNDTAGAADSVQERKDPLGRTVAHVGGELAGGQLAIVADVLATPDKYAGKLLQLEGNVSAMCEGRRAWFAIVGNDQTGASLRVLTAPVFLVPAGSVGKQVRVEGKLETTELSPETANHLEKDHKLPTPHASNGPVTQTVLRATVAEFY